MRTDGQADRDRQDEANIRFSQFCEKRPIKIRLVVRSKKNPSGL